MNKLVVIGWMGVKTCYVNVPVKEAIRRWEADNGQIDESMVNESFIAEFDFMDEFDAYDASGCFDSRRIYNRDGEPIR